MRLEAQANGPFEYTTFRPSENLFVLDLSGVSAGDPAGVRVVASDLMKSYRVSILRAGKKPVVRVEILLSQGVEPQLERTDAQDLTSVGFAQRRCGLRRQSCTVTGRRPVSAAVRSRSEAKAPERPTTSIATGQPGAEWGSNRRQCSRLRTSDLSRDPLQNPDRLVLDFAGFALEDLGEAYCQQSRSRARNSPGSVHAGSFADGDRSARAGALQHQHSGKHGDGFVRGGRSDR